MKWMIVLMVLVLAACAPGSSPQSVELEGTRWQLESLNGTPVVPGSTVTLQFDAENFAGGNSGCNSYGGSYSLDGSSIEFSEIASTLMACMDDGIMDQEAAYLGALNSAQQVTLDGDRLTITHPGGQLNFVPAAD
jgi:heat shock protein HslJ